MKFTLKFDFKFGRKLFVIANAAKIYALLRHCEQKTSGSEFLRGNPLRDKVAFFWIQIYILKSWIASAFSTPRNDGLPPLNFPKNFNILNFHKPQKSPVKNPSKPRHLCLLHRHARKVRFFKPLHIYLIALIPISTLIERGYILIKCVNSEVKFG